MCLIIVAEDKHPTLETLKLAQETNKDGAGVVYIGDDGMATWKKGLDFNQVNDLIQTLSFPYVVHFRRGSHGLKKDILLCHPFVISNDSPLSLEGKATKLLIHNGTMIEMDWKLCLAASGLDFPMINADLMSDSRALAIVLSKHDNYNFLTKIKGNFVYVDSQSENPFVIIGDTFKFENGLYYSNLEWREKKNNYVSSYYDAGSYNDNNYCGNPRQTQIPFNNKADEKDELLEKLKYSQNIVCCSCFRALTPFYIEKIYKLGYISPENMKCGQCLPRNPSIHIKLESGETDEYYCATTIESHDKFYLSEESGVYSTYAGC